ncbi:hypothetical protein BDW68DRAFT_190550 [Aspergillus falconensis]
MGYPASRKDGTGGLGDATATALATANPAPAHIILLARSEPKVHDVINKINENSPQTKCSFISIELNDFDSHGKIDLLISNAGVMAIPWGKGKNAIEKTLAIYHLGHFMLMGLVMPLILMGDDGRVVNISSAGLMHYQDSKTYHPLSAYAQSKTANILFTIGLAQRYKRNGLLAFAAHPGSRENTGYPFGPDPPKSLEQGIAMTLHNGAYLTDCQVADVRPYAKNPEMVQFLRELSEKLVGGLDSLGR